MAENYQQQLDELLAQLAAEGRRPKLLLQVCCAPCGSYCLEYLCRAFEITAYFYNPNIAPESEYCFRLAELYRLTQALADDGRTPAVVPVQEGQYCPQEFDVLAKGLEREPERGARCRKCYELRLRRTAEAAKAGGYDYFCTTLSISPHKNADWLNELGREIGQQTGVAYLVSDFKKKGGYTKSIENSKKYNLYRQNYCGCVYSKAEAERRAAQPDP